MGDHNILPTIGNHAISNLLKSIHIINNTLFTNVTVIPHINIQKHNIWESNRLLDTTGAMENCSAGSMGRLQWPYSFKLYNYEM